MSQINVAILDQNPLFEAAFKSIFGSEPGLFFAGRIDCTSSTSDDGRSGPSVIIVEADTVDGNLVPHLHKRFPGVKVLLLCRTQDAQAVCAALQNGVHGCLSVRSTPDEIVRATKCIANGEQYLSPTLAMQLLGGAVPKPASDDPFASLTDREEQIVKLLGIGLSNKEIGWRLTISEKTVKHYLTSILGKLNVRNRVQAALLAAGRSGSVSYA